jgi:hypothetical protein
VRDVAVQGGRAEGYFFSCLFRCVFWVCVSVCRCWCWCVCRRLCWLVLYVRWFATALRCLSRVRVGCVRGTGLLAALCTYVRKGFSLPARLGFVFCGTGCCRASASHPTRGVRTENRHARSRFSRAEESKSLPCPMTVAASCDHIAFRCIGRSGRHRSYGPVPWAHH